jgi:hypothetical protein
MAEKLCDDPTVREIYSNRVASFTFDGAAFAITLAQARQSSERLDEPGNVVAVVNNRLCIPTHAALQLHTMLGRALTQIAAATSTSESTPNEQPQMAKRPRAN